MTNALDLRPLACDPRELLAGVPALGAVVARTRSAAATLENVGTYGAPDIGEHTGIVIGDGIDLRVFPRGWYRAFRTTDVVRVENERGDVVHEIVAQETTARDAFDAWTASLEAPSARALPAADSIEDARETADAAIDVAAYRAAYGAMTDTHDFFMLLRRFGLAREQGLRLADPAFARPVAPDAHRALFARAAAEAIPLMLFVASDGMVQIASGPVPAATVDATGIFSLVGARFALHLDERAVSRAWVVRKPTSLGIVSSLELYDATGELVLQLFGERHEGDGERADWAAALERLVPADG